MEQFTLLERLGIFIQFNALIAAIVFIIAAMNEFDRVTRIGYIVRAAFLYIVWGVGLVWVLLGKVSFGFWQISHSTNVSGIVELEQRVRPAIVSQLDQRKSNRTPLGQNEYEERITILNNECLSESSWLASDQDYRCDCVRELLELGLRDYESFSDSELFCDF